MWTERSVEVPNAVYYLFIVAILLRVLIDVVTAV
jgi:hypothetical protein